MTESWECGTLFDHVNTDEGSLAIGAPGQVALTRVANVIRKATEYVLSTGEGATGKVLQYGPEAGSPLYCSEVSKFLTRQYKDTVKQSEIILSSGATNGLHLVTSLLVKPGAAVFVEDPTYFLAISALRDDMCMNVVPVTSSDSGIDTDNLESLLQTHIASQPTSSESSHRFNGMVYMVPTYNNPKTLCYPADKCERLVKLARKYNVLLLCDDVYNILTWDATQQPPKRLLQYDKELPGYTGHVISNGSFSKLMGPGLRCGWIETSEKNVEYLCNTALIKSSGSVNHYTSQLISAALQHGWVDDLVATTNKEFLIKTQAVNDTLDRLLPIEITYLKPKGGYFYWLKFAADVDTKKMADYLKQKKDLVVMPGVLTSVTGSYTNCMRISVSYYEEKQLVRAITLLCEGAKEFISMSS